MTKNDLIESIAQVIYYYEGGMTPDDFEQETGKIKPSWYEKEGVESLPEHERDDYRFSAKKIIDLLEHQELIACTYQKGTNSLEIMLD